MALIARLREERLRGAHLGYQVASVLSRLLPSAVSLSLTEVAADLVWGLNRAGARAVASNLSVVLGRSVKPDERLVREVFRNFGRYLRDFLKGASPEGPRVVFEDSGRLRQIVRRGAGAVLLSAHMTNWELLASCLSRELERPLVSVALPHPNLRVNQLIAQRRLAAKVRAIMIGKQTTRACLKVLAGGGTVGLIGDHCFGTPGAAVTLFGRQVLLPTGPSLLSWRARVPLVPIFILREKPGLFRIHLSEPIWPAELLVGFKEARGIMMAAYAKALERIVRQAPEQWLLFRPLGLVPELEVSAQGMRS